MEDLKDLVEELRVTSLRKDTESHRPILELERIDVSSMEGWWRQVRYYRFWWRGHRTTIRMYGSWKIDPKQAFDEPINTDDLKRTALETIRQWTKEDQRLQNEYDDKGLGKVEARVSRLERLLSERWGLEEL